MKAIVYTSSAGHTAEYAKILGEKTGLPVYALNEALKQLSNGIEIIYLGWLFANGIKGYKKAAKKYNVSAICAVGLCDTGTALDDVRKINALSEEIPLFTMQCGMDKSKLRGINKLMINMLTKGLSSRKERSENDEHMLYLLTHDLNYVSEENITAFMEWYENTRLTIKSQDPNEKFYEKSPPPLTNSIQMLRETSEGDGESKTTKAIAPLAEEL